LVERTRERPITSGKISVTQASILLAILLGMALSLVLFLNPFTILLSFAGLIFACTYPWLKRVTHLPQLGLGICFSWGIPMAFAAQNNFISTGGWLVFLAAIIWPVIYDTQYALVDRNDDETIGVKSTAILFGKYNHVLISLLQMVFLLSLIAVGKHFQLASSFYISLILAGILFIYQFWLLHTGMRKNYFKAFLNNNWVGMIIFIGIILGLYQ
jgi:4-hydroxybenzoate polyprenyltransferase